MTDIREAAKVPVDSLRWKLAPGSLHFTTTDELEVQTDIIGQDRGVDAFRFGMGMDAKGYNIFVTGAAHVGKLAVVKRLLENSTRKQETPDDVCYVNNFKTPEEPILLRFVAGNGTKFKAAVDKFLERIKRDVPQLFESQEYINSKNLIIEEHDKKTREFFKGLEERVKDAGFVMVNMQMGNVQRPDIVPIVDGEPVHLLKLEELMEKGRFPKEEFAQLQEKYKELKEEIDAIFLDVRALQKEVKRKSEDVDKLMFMNIARELAQPLRNGWRDQEKVEKFVDAMLEDMADNLDALKSMGQPQQGPMGMTFPGASADAVLHPYGVNLLVDNSESEGPPVIVESHPTYRNLFGSIERVMDRNGLWRTDYKKINAGSFIKANGGYLVLNLMDAIMEPGVWQTLKRALKTSEIEIQTFDPYYLLTTTALKPEPIAMEVKVVVLATPNLYHMLRYYDDDVDRIFKVRADFETSMNRDDKAVQDISRLVKTFAEDRKLMAFHADAVAALLEHGVRLAGRQEKISTSFPILSDIMEEANFLARESGSDAVRGEHVRNAVEARIYRSNQIEDRLQEMIDRGSVFIDTEGEVAGQINGLAVYSLGDYSFGKPARITCATSIGKEGIINIEREADMSGSTHNKGMLILSGYLRKNFAQNKPLTLAASIAFEQSYGGIDGDSASSTELYALLSSLAEVPIRQGIAVTGSVNQKGEVQPIGGVNEKIEGFFKVCRQRGLTGDQGVMIPKANVKDLMLRDEVVQAVEEGKFHVWAVSHVNEGIEILTGRAAGERQPDGAYPSGTVNALVDEKLLALAEGLRDFAKKKNGDRKADAENDE
ncbi:Lon protease family protein [Desulfovibrio psychrotolerans]|uniref:endopeptidase La n=1 Tax=Desulfovibrio psychrotolerans TaxID=415242 RepID=A0A7J0BPA8_9BACT|nr:ATP-binding protein [Desulfovibrio psychrotolerans]GFM35536.1 ATP-dependent protease [Desulfovibrio psychrotolerans]